MPHGSTASRPHSPAATATAADSSNSSGIPRRASPPSQSLQHSSYQFLQSPTHARSNSGTISYSSSHLQSHPRTYTTNTSKDASASTLSHGGFTRPLSPEPEAPTMMSFASGYILHQSTAHTIAKPVAIYPQEHPQRKRFSPRFSASAASYTTYSSALASTIQQQQQQQQQRKSCHQHYDSMERHQDSSVADTALYSSVSGYNHPTQNRHSYNSPPSPCAALDASSCQCSRPNRHSHSHSRSQSSSIPMNASCHIVSQNSSALPSPSLSVFSTEGSSVMSTTTSMDQCSPTLSNTITALLPDVIQFGGVSSALRASSQQQYASSPCPSPADPSSPLEESSGLVSLPSSSYCSTRASSPVRARRTSSLASSAGLLLLSSPPSPSSCSSSSLANECGCFVTDPSTSPRPEGLMTQGQQRHPQRSLQHQQRQPEHQKHARQSLAAQTQGQTKGNAQAHRQSAYLLDARQHTRSALGASTFPPTSRPSSTLTSVPPNSSQAIAQGSSRYIRLLWLPLLPLLILAFGGPTSPKFESPTKY